jgi:hypothetical protein
MRFSHPYSIHVECRKQWEVLSGNQTERQMEVESMIRLKVCLTFLFALTLGAMVGVAQAGVIRYAGKEIAKGADNASQIAAASGAALAGGTASAGQATAGVLKTGFTATKDGVAAAAGGVAAAGDAVVDGSSGIARTAKNVPSAVAQGARNVAQKAWHIIW